jgi:hypothetical protein
MSGSLCAAIRRTSWAANPSLESSRAARIDTSAERVLGVVRIVVSKIEVPNSVRLSESGMKCEAAVFGPAARSSCHQPARAGPHIMVRALLTMLVNI